MFCRQVLSNRAVAFAYHCCLCTHLYLWSFSLCFLQRSKINSQFSGKACAMGTRTRTLLSFLKVVSTLFPIVWLLLSAVQIVRCDQTNNKTIGILHIYTDLYESLYISLIVGEMVNNCHIMVDLDDTIRNGLWIFAFCGFASWTTIF